MLEAVFEEMSVKQQVFAELEAVVSPETILATNTSSLSDHGDGGRSSTTPSASSACISSTRSPCSHSSRSSGRPRRTTTTLATAWETAKKLRKRPVLAKDAPAFIVNRVLTRMTVVLMDALEQGNTVDETDEAILRLGMPMAPSVLLQMVGPRVANHVLHTLNEAYPDRFPLSETLANYADGREEIAVHGDNRRTVEEIQQAALEAIADEIHHMLEEGVVESPKDIDTALLLGAGWPFFLGGITKYLEQTGMLRTPATA